ncbi:MAG: TetR/AcrR family transcriptional regulator [Pseudomonadota bacterium]
MNSFRPTARNAIVDAGFTIFNRDPSASLAQVAELAGVGRATLHRHFSSRADLLSALSQIAIKEMDDAVEEACSGLTSYGEAMRVSLDVLIPLGDRYGFLSLDAVEHDPDLQCEFTRQRQETEEMVAGAQDEGLFDPAVPTAWIVQAYEYLLYAAWESVKAEETTRQQASDLAWQTLTSGLGGNAK